MLGREVVESQQNITVLDQLGNGPLIFHPVGFHEEIKGRISFLFCLGHLLPGRACSCMHEKGEPARWIWCGCCPWPVRSAACPDCPCGGCGFSACGLAALPPFPRIDRLQAKHRLCLGKLGSDALLGFLFHDRSLASQGASGQRIHNGGGLNYPSPHSPPSSHRRSPQLSPHCS